MQNRKAVATAFGVYAYKDRSRAASQCLNCSECSNRVLYTMNASVLKFQLQIEGQIEGPWAYNPIHFISTKVFV